VRIALLIPLLAACHEAPKPDASASPSASAKVVASAVTSAAVTHAWFEGAWQGSFQAELLRIELATGGVKEWKQDDGKPASGPGQLKLVVSADGSVSGSASGALGELAVNGHVDGDRAALTLASADPDGFHGFVMATQTPEGMQGTLNASSADSLQVRQAKVTFTRATP
jgi:hypothetical protein